jgi:hypothetical protein
MDIHTCSHTNSRKIVIGWGYAKQFQLCFLRCIKKNRFLIIIKLVVHNGVEVLTFKGPTDERLIGFTKVFSNKCKNSGMGVSNEPLAILPTAVLPHIKDDPGCRCIIESISQTIKHFGDAKGISFILVLLQKKDNYILPDIKRLVSMSVYVCALVSFILVCLLAVALVGLAIGNARYCPAPSVCV